MKKYKTRQSKVFCLVIILVISFHFIFIKLANASIASQAVLPLELHPPLIMINGEIGPTYPPPLLEEFNYLPYGGGYGGYGYEYPYDGGYGGLYGF